MQIQELKAQTSKSKMPVWYMLAIIAFSAIFVFSLTMLVTRVLADKQSQDEFAGLEALIESTSTAAESTPQNSGPSNMVKFSSLCAKNADFIGWLSIDGTNLSYPVMYKPSQLQFYLRHDFDGQYSIYGVPYVEEACFVNPQSTNVIIYGHNMKTGTIFGCLTGYKEQSYYKEHPVIEFDTLYGDGKYEVFAAFAIDVTADTSFRYNTFTDTQDPAEYDAFVAEVKRRSDVDSGITPQFGEQLLTLSTCEYSTDDGRYVVVARKVA